MKLTKLLVPAAGLSLILGVSAAFAQYGPPPGPPPGYQQGPPPGPPIPYGQGAERDYANHRIWNVNNRDEFRHPHVPGNVRGDYRSGFKKGYYQTAQHYQGGPGPYGPR
jgi:hypothetical protein